MRSLSKTTSLRIVIIILITASIIGGFKLMTKSRFLGSSDFNQAQTTLNQASKIEEELALIPIDADNSEQQSTGLKFKSKEDATKYANLKAKSDDLIDLAFIQTLAGSSEAVKQILILLCVGAFIALTISTIENYRQSKLFRKKRETNHD